MTCHNAPAYQATNKSHDSIRQKQDFWYEHQRHCSLAHEPIWRPTREFGPLVLSSRSGGGYMELGDLVALFVGERLGYASVLESLGFRYETGVSIVRCWVALELNAPAGGPYNLLGVALATIAELGEPERISCGNAMDSKATNGFSRSDWQVAFAQVLNYEALGAICSLGAYLAPDFTKAKWLVYHMIMRRWEGLLGRERQLYDWPPCYQHTIREARQCCYHG